MIPVRKILTRPLVVHCALWPAHPSGAPAAVGLVRSVLADGSVSLREPPRRWCFGAAELIAAGLASADAEAVVAAAWLHDVDYAPSVRRSTGFHPVDGALFVRAQGFPAVVVSLVAYHTGAVFEAGERGLLDALAEFSEPPELLLDVLTCADMTTGPDGSRVRVEDRVREILSRYPEDDPVHRAIERATPTLLASVARIDALVAG